jgi:hypothetical protein
VTGASGSPQTRDYVVVGPMRGEVIPILDDGTGPMEYGCAYVEVKATDRNAAIRAAQRDRAVDRLIDEARGDGKHPYAYLRVLLNPTHCHVEAAESDEDICPACTRQLERIQKSMARLDEKFS